MEKIVDNKHGFAETRGFVNSNGIRPSIERQMPLNQSLRGTILGYTHCSVCLDVLDHLYKLDPVCDSIYYLLKYRVRQYGFFLL